MNERRRGPGNDKGSRDGEWSRTVLLPPDDAGGAGEGTPEGPWAGVESPSDRTGGQKGRHRGGWWLSVVVPGLPQLLAGRVVTGGYVLLLWIGGLGLGALRWGRVLAAPTGPLEEQVALAGLMLALVGLWGWSLRDVRRGSPDPDQRPSQWALALRSFRRNRLAVCGALAVATLSLLALLAPLVAPFDPTLQGDLMTRRLVGPSPEHLLGTDQYARDIFSRLLYGARISLAIGFLAVGIAVSIGTLVGSVAAFAGGRVDEVVMRFVDMVIAFPRLVLLIAVIALFRPSMVVIVVVLGLTQWPQVARIVRGEVLSVREREFVEAARALGFSRTRIVVRHILPNIMAPVVVVATLGIGDTIILEAVLSFLGLGIQAPTPSWGMMVAEGRSHLLGAWWISTFSGLAIVATVLSFNLAGDGLRDALDPRLRR